MIRTHFRNAKIGFISNQDFWSLLEPFSGFHGNEIPLSKKIESYLPIKTYQDFFRYFKNVVEKYSGRKPSGFAKTAPIPGDQHTVRLTF